MMLVIPIFIPHRGCPHDCLFCNQKKISGCSESVSTEVAVGENIEQWLSRKGDRRQVQVAFFGGSFTCLPPEEQITLLSQVQPYIKDGRVDSIRLSTRPDCIDHNVCELLMKYNVATVELGIQSLNNAVLSKAKRGHSAEQSRTAFDLLKKSTMQVGVQLMVGLPGESSCSFLRNIAEVISWQPDLVRLYPVLVVKESGLENLYRAGGYRPLGLNKAIALTGRAFARMTAAGVDVVRMGLQPSTSLQENVVAGPYHPAFGELVRSRLWFKKMRYILSHLRPQQNLIFHVSHRDISAVVGMKKKNIMRLEELGFKDRFTVVPDKTMVRGTLHYAVC